MSLVETMYVYSLHSTVVVSSLFFAWFLALAQNFQCIQVLLVARCVPWNTVFESV